MNRARLPLLLTALAVTLPLAEDALAAKRKVPQQYATIQAAVDDAGPGDVVLISPGVHPETVTIIGKQDLVLRGKGKAVIDAGGAAAAILLQGTNDVRIENLRLRNAVVGVDANLCGDLVVEGCRVTDVTGSALHLEFCAGARVTGCRIAGSESHGILLRDSTGCLVDGCRISNVAFYAIAMSGSAHSIVGNEVEQCGSYGVRVGLSMTAATSCLVAENRIESVGGTGVLVTNWSTDASVIDNVLVDTGGDGVYANPACDGAVVAGNVIRRVADSGVEIHAEDAVVAENRVKSAADRGIDLTPNATGALVAGNRIKKPTAEGIRVAGSGNAFVGNEVKKSGGVALSDEAGPGANYYVGNSFDGP